MRRALAVTLLFAACKSSPEQPIDIEDSAQCFACHADITREWNESMHARASRGDPIYAAVLALRAKREGPDLAAKCAGCHAPRPEPTTTATTAHAGVSCAACHNVTSVGAEGHGAARLVRAPPRTLLGPSDVAPGASPAHLTGPAAPHLADGSTLCLACHDALANARKISLCATGVEWRSSAPDGAPPSCTSCHMPRVPGLASINSKKPDHAEHRFLGPARLAHYPDGRRPQGGVHVALSIDGGEAVAAVTNESPHAFPTGFPGRAAAITVRALDASGAAIATSTAGLMKVYLDEAGKPTMAPYAVALAKDSRLTAGETRRVRVPLKPGAEQLDADVKSMLVAPPLAKALGMEGSPLVKPEVLTRGTLPAPRPDNPPRPGSP